MILVLKFLISISSECHVRSSYVLSEIVINLFQFLWNAIYIVVMHDRKSLLFLPRRWRSFHGVSKNYGTSKTIFEIGFKKYTVLTSQIYN